MREYAVFIFPELWTYPKPVDFEDVTQEEQDNISAWEKAKDSNFNLKSKISRAEGWRLSGEFVDIVDPSKGVRITKSSEFYISMWFPVERILENNPKGWFVSKMAKLSEFELKFQGFIAKDVHAELIERGYKIVRGEEIR